MTVPNADLLTPQLRAIEFQVDHAYQSNPLFQLRFAPAAWHLLAVTELDAFKHAVTDEQHSMHGVAALADNLVNDLNYPLRWLFTSCQPGGRPRFSNEEAPSKAAWDLLRTGHDYNPFIAAFTFASRGRIELMLRERTLIPSENLYDQIEYEAYNRLIKVLPLPPDFDLSPVSAFPIDALQRSLKVTGERFTYKLSPKIVADTMRALSPVLAPRGTLPAEWLLANYTIGDFRRIFDVITALAYIHFMARNWAASMGCINTGFANSIYVVSRDELINSRP